jgi:hypothetical protein
LEVEVVVWHVETDGEDDESVENDYAEGNFASRDFDGLVAVHMLVLSSCDGDREEALQGKEDGVHG